MSDALKPYFAKRNFAVTGEPRGERGREAPKAGALQFVVQKHAARSLHYDFRLELDGTLKSWAVPKGPSLDPADKRMAVQVEDHPLDYAGFEGTIPAGQYGAGTVIVWDRGTWQAAGDAASGYRDGKLKFVLEGHKLSGAWTLVRMKGRGNEKQKPWLLIKERDAEARPAADYSVVDAEPDSVLAPARARPARLSAHAPAAEPGAKVSTSKAASKGALPQALSPQLATLASGPPATGEWAWEIKFDGYRLLARVEGDDVRLFTRNGHDWTSRMPRLAAAVQALDLGSAWLDGEIVVAKADGTPDFGALQNVFDANSAGAADVIDYFVFDLPFHDGLNLRKRPLQERRSLLEQLLARAPQPRVRFSQSFDAAPAELLQNACRLRLEGVIGKRLDSPYVSRRAPTWIKLKCTHRQEFVIGGWTDPQGSRSGLGSLLLGIHDSGGALRYAGAVGSGFDQRTLFALRKKLDAIGIGDAPFAPAPKGVKGHWVKPRLVAEVSFGEWTRDGHIRHSVFHGLRDDKEPATIVREQPEAPAKVERATGADATKVAKKAAPSQTARETKSAARAKPAAAESDTARPAAAAKRATKAKPAATANPTVQGVRISHADRVVDTPTGATKLDVVNHYLLVAKTMLPHLVKRPVSLVRAPSGLDGQLFFQRHADTLKIAELKELDPAISPGKPPMVEVDSFTALISAAQANVIEFHTWNATTRDIARPDRLVFDLDPGEGVAWKRMQQGAELMRALLAELGLESFLKTSGGKGLHVVVPIAPRDDWDTTKATSKAIVEHLAEVIPDRFVAKSGPKNRVGRIFADYLRNGFGATTAAAWSLRARPGLGVSVPCAWDELGSIASGAHWHIGNVHERLEEARDPWAGYSKKRQTLAKAKKEFG